MPEVLGSALFFVRDITDFARLRLPRIRGIRVLLVPCDVPRIFCRNVSWSEAFGFQGESNIGQSAFPAVQVKGFGVAVWGEK